MLKVGDKIVLSYIQDMDPGVIRKIEGDMATVDLGGAKPFNTKLSDLVLAEDTAEIEFSPAQPKEDNMFAPVVAAMEESIAVEDMLEKITAGIKFENEYRTIESSLGKPETPRITAEVFYIGAPVRRIGSQRTGTIVTANKKDHSYKVKWEDNSVTVNWKGELGLIG